MATPAVSPRLVACWLATVAFAVGPYLLLRQVLPAEDATLLRYYIPGFATYVGIAYLVEPRWDPERLGWFGGLVDNPFSREDDWNRMMRDLAIVLWPGRLVCATVGYTVSALLRHGSSAPPHSP